MFNTKSFCHVDTFTSNEPGINSTLGEITSRIQTFSREVGKYANAAYPNLTLYTLYSKAGSGPTSTSEQLSFTDVEKCLAMCNFIVTQIATSSGELYQDILQQQLQDFGSTIGLVGVVVGAVNQHGTRWGPDFISFQLGSDTSQEHTIWFSSLAIEAQYTEYEIVVVPPITPLDNFFTAPGNVQNLLNASTQESVFNRVNVAANGKPPTLIVSRSFDYYNPQNSAQTFETKWACLIYGPAGDNIDSIKDALVNHILANSAHDREDWMSILPDIFKRTEFVIAPLWDQYAVEPLILHPQGIRSPIAKLEDIVRYATLCAQEYDPVHIQEHVTPVVFNYSSILTAIIGNAENREAKFSILDYYPDYFVAATTSIDFNRMQIPTQNWVIDINTMLAHAEVMTAVSSVPAGYTRVVRDNMVYISKTINNIAYLVAVKSTVLTALE